MKQRDERENRIHLESSRNGFIAYTFVTISFWAYKMTQTGETPWDLYAIAYGPFFIFVMSIIYYRQKGLKNSLNLSKLGQD